MICGKCKRDKPIEDFTHQRGLAYPTKWCERCKKYSREFQRRRALGKTRVMQHSGRPRTAEGGGYSINSRRALLTSRTAQELRQRLLKEQGGKCAICGKARQLYLDHCHKAMRLRKLLCMNCNTALGKFEDDPQRLLSAVRYLEDHNFGT